MVKRLLKDALVTHGKKNKKTKQGLWVFAVLEIKAASRHHILHLMRRRNKETLAPIKKHVKRQCMCEWRACASLSQED